MTPMYPIFSFPADPCLPYSVTGVPLVHLSNPVLLADSPISINIFLFILLSPLSVPVAVDI